MNIRVVVADDFPLVREGIVRAINHDPALEVVGQATTGREAIALAEELRPDVMILDLRMPDLGGLEVLDKLRASQPQIRVIVMTANEQAGTLLDAIAAGAAGYLSKRTPGEELRQAVITAHGGGSVITPSLASHLLKEFSSSDRGEQSAVRPLQNHLTRVREKTGLRRRPPEDGGATGRVREPRHRPPDVGSASVRLRPAGP